MEGRVVSLETGEDVNPGEEGEILLRGLTLRHFNIWVCND